MRIVKLDVDRSLCVELFFCQEIIPPLYTRLLCLSEASNVKAKPKANR